SDEVKPLFRDRAFELVEADLYNDKAIFRRIRDREFDSIVHLASLTHIPLCEKYPAFAYKSNFISALNLILALPPECRFINFSTSSTYSPSLELHEESQDALVPIDFYGWAKKHVEDLCQYYAQRNGLRILNIRLANAAGFGETNVKLLGEI